MKRKIIRLSQHYLRTLRNYLQQGGRTSLLPALRLGRRAVDLGLETLQLAQIHEKSLEAMRLSEGGRLVRRAAHFFTEAITPIVATHQAAKRTKSDLNRMIGSLHQRTLELAATKSQLQRGIGRRKAVEATLKRSAAHYSRLLSESLQLQKGLRALTHRVLLAQEDERKSISHELQDEIAQTLLGINVRLHSLKQEARSSTTGLRNEIASTQRLVAGSARSVRRLARGFSNA